MFVCSNQLLFQSSFSEKSYQNQMIVFLINLFNLVIKVINARIEKKSVSTYLARGMKKIEFMHRNSAFNL